MSQGLQCILLLCAGLISFEVLIIAQPTQTQDNLAPPPVKKVPSDDLAKLNDARDYKMRTSLSLELAKNHLVAAETLTKDSQFDEAGGQLGIYRAIYENVLKYLDGLPKKTDKIRDAYRRVEISLRDEVTRIETIRRSTPREFAVNVKTLVEYTKDAREQALSAFYGETVLQDADAIGKKGAESGQGKKQVPPGESKEP